MPKSRAVLNRRRGNAKSRSAQFSLARRCRRLTIHDPLQSRTNADRNTCKRDTHRWKLWRTRTYVDLQKLARRAVSTMFRLRRNQIPVQALRIVQLPTTKTSSTSARCCSDLRRLTSRRVGTSTLTCGLVAIDAGWDGWVGMRKAAALSSVWLGVVVRLAIRDPLQSRTNADRNTCKRDTHRWKLWRTRTYVDLQYLRDELP